MIRQWTFFTNHAHILFLLAIDPDIAVKDIAAQVGITERATLRIIADLAKDHFITITKNGRCNSYSVNNDQYLRHDIEGKCKVGDIIKLIKKSKRSS